MAGGAAPVQPEPMGAERLQDGPRQTEGHPPIELIPLAPHEILAEALRRVERPTRGYWTLVVVLAILTAVGLVGFAVRLAGGFANRAAWGYYATMFICLMSMTQPVPIVTWMSRFAKGQWSLPFRRIADLFGVIGILNLLWFIPLLWTIPPLEGRKNMWFDWPLLAPWGWDLIGMLLLVGAGLAHLWVSALPDFAVLRDASPPGARRWAAGLALGFQGTIRQWRVVTSGQIIVGGILLAAYVYILTLLAGDLSMSLVPGWRSAVYPGFVVVTGWESGVATLIVTMALLRRFGGLRDYLTVDQFWALAKLLLVLVLFWFYLFWVDFLMTWYGRQPTEQDVLQLTIFGPYWVPFLLSTALMLVLPLALLIANKVRTSVRGATVVAVLVMIGTFFDRVRLFVAAYSIPDPFAAPPIDVPPTHFPDLADAGIILLGIAAPALVYVLAWRVVPLLPLWELREGLLLRAIRPFVRTRVAVIAKPF
jgi:molybdopterin-containing oxidoreductase family membrane subunit